MRIFEAVEAPFGEDVPEQFRNSALEYELKLYNGRVARAVVYLVYAEPLRESAPGVKKLGVHDGQGYCWLPVVRERCVKGCEGPILSAIQRFGKQGRTQKSAASQKDSAQASKAKPTAEDKWKDSRNLFISIDEASNHVCPYGPNKCKVFRLLFGVYEQNTTKLLGSGVSGPIRVLANNDVPQGAAAMKVRCGLNDSWVGWNDAVEKDEEKLRDIFKNLCPQAAGKTNHDKLREKRLEESQQDARKPLQNKTNLVGKTTKRASMKATAAPATKRAKSTGVIAPPRQNAKTQQRNDFDFDIAYAATNMSESPFNFQAVVPSPLGTPPDERVAGQTNAGFVNLFGTPDFHLAAQDMMTDALNTADLPPLCTPGDRRAENFQDAAPPTTGMGTFRFTPSIANMASGGSLMSLSGLDSLHIGGSAFGKTPAEFKTKTESKVFTRSAKKAAATQPTPGTVFINNLLVSGQKIAPTHVNSAVQTSRRSTRAAAKQPLADETAPRTTAASRLVATLTSTGPSAGPAPPTGVASAPGVNVQDATYETGPVRAGRSRHASPTGVAPVRLLFTSPSGRGTADELDASDVDDDDVGLTSPNAAFGARRNARSGQTTRFPTIASLPELVEADKATARVTTKVGRLSGHFRREAMPPPPKHVAEPEMKRKTRNSMVHFSGDVNFDNTQSLSKHALKASEPSEPKMDRADVSSLLSPEWKSVSKKRKGMDKRTKQTREKPQGLIEKAKCAILGTSH